MKKIILSIAMVAIAFGTYAQVGVGTTDPKTSLEVRGSNDAAAAASATGGALVAADGVTVPRTSSNMKATSGLASGVLVGQLVYSTNAASTGFYYWNGTAWTALVAAGGGGGSSSAVPNYGAATTVPIVSAAADISASTSNHFIFTGGGFFVPYVVTLPTPATNTGRKIIFNNIANSASTATFTNTLGGTVAIAGGRVVELYCTGTGWAIITNN